VVPAAPVRSADEQLKHEMFRPLDEMAATGVAHAAG
jgi:hypothetical protein